MKWLHWIHVSTRKRKEIWLRALRLTTNGVYLCGSHIASFYFRILISESRVSDSSCLGKAGVAPGFVVLSDTVFRNDSQQGGLERGTKVSWETVPYVQLDFQCFAAFRRLKWNMSRRGRARTSRGVCLYLKTRCYFANPKSPFSSPTSVLCVSHFWWAVMWFICDFFLCVARF